MQDVQTGLTKKEKEKRKRRRREEARYVGSSSLSHIKAFVWYEHYRSC
jgi:hypothetical protein